MKDSLIWIDMEFTGLDLDKDVILEIATVVTDGDLNVLSEGPNIAVHQDDGMLAGMDEWNRKHHRESGLVDRVRASAETAESAEEKTLEFLRTYCEPGKAPLCGNSVHQDRAYIVKYMPRLNNFLHYRNIDVSSIKELVRRWYPKLPEYKKKQTHKAHEDILESIGELRYYRENVFRRRTEETGL